MKKRVLEGGGERKKIFKRMKGKEKHQRDIF